MLGTMIAAIEKWKETEQWHKNGGQFIPIPVMWLNQRRWEDEVPAASASRRPTVVAQQYEQRDYSGVQAELIARQDAEMEEYMKSGGLALFGSSWQYNIHDMIKTGRKNERGSLGIR